MRVITIVGARPQFIKAAAVSRAFSKMCVDELIVHTGQHYDAGMSDVFFEQMDIPKPSHHLGVGSGHHGAMTGRQLEEIEKVLLSERPDWVLVYGDTNSTLAGALAAAKLHIPVAHVEAGLRSFNRRMPEEVNRVLTDHASTLLFAPTETAVKNLAAEGLDGASVNLVGDVMFDATLFYRKDACMPNWFSGLGVQPGRFVLCTVHRAENTDDEKRLVNIMAALGKLKVDVVFPLHPRTRLALESAKITAPSNVHLSPPVGYFEMSWLESMCLTVVTDSGGVQKEAYFHRKQCVTLRDETEWVELVESGWNTLASPLDQDAMLAAIDGAPHRKGSDVPLYGDGEAARRIVQRLLRAGGAK